MKTVMQELRDDLELTLGTGKQALDDINDLIIRETCQKVVQLTLELIIKRIDEELLKMEEDQRKNDFREGWHGNKHKDWNCEFYLQKHLTNFKSKK